MIHSPRTSVAVVVVLAVSALAACGSSSADGTSSASGPGSGGSTPATTAGAGGDAGSATGGGAGTATGSGASSAAGGSSGTWAHGGTITLRGSGFGERPSFGPAGSPLLARAWDGCASDDPSAVWDEFGPTAADGGDPAYQLRCRTPEEVSALKVAGPAPATAHGHAARYLAGGAVSSNAAGSMAYVTVRDTEVSPYFYASFYYRADPDWHPEPNSDGNHKMYAYSAGNTAYSENGFWYFGFEGFQAPEGGIAMTPNYFTGLFTPCENEMPKDLRCVDPDLVNWYMTGCGGNGDGTACTLFPKLQDPRHPRKEWVKIEYVFKHADAVDGVHDVYLDNLHRWHAELDDDALGTLPTARAQTLGGYRRDYGLTDEYKNNWSYFSDVYVDLSWARVMLANAATYADATVVEPQPPIAWADDAIEVQVNLGALASGETAWVYVFDANGELVGGQPLTSFEVP